MHLQSPARAFIAAILALAWLQVPAQNGTGSESRPTAERSFDVLEFQVEGNTVLDTERIERAVYPFLGEGKTIADVESARAALEKAYRDAGYATVAVDIPEQKVVNGTVVLNVVQGRVSRLRVVGARYFSQDRIIAAVPSLAEGSVPRLPEVQAQITDVNSTVDKRVTPLLRPGKEPGTTEVDLQVEDKLPLHGSVEVNNHNSPNTTESRLVASLRYSNLFQKEHTISLQAQVSPQDTSEVRVIAGSYSLPAGSGIVALSGVYSNSNTFVGGGVGVFGKTKIFGVRYIQSLGTASPSASDSLSVGIDYKSADQDVALADGSGTTTPIHYAPLSLVYSALRADSAGSTEASAGLTWAIRGIASDELQFSDKRFHARSNFAVVKFGLGRTHRLPADLSLYARIDGQLTDQPLVSNEQFVAGGVDSVRGYLEATQVGDAGLRGSLELRSKTLGTDSTRFGTVQLRTFFDGAYLRLRSPLPGQKDAFELLGVGFGASLRSPNGFNARADVAWPLRDSGDQQAYRVRVQANATYEF